MLSSQNKLKSKADIDLVFSKGVFLKDSGFVLGRAQEISRDEVKFTRFIER